VVRIFRGVGEKLSKNANHSIGLKYKALRRYSGPWLGFIGEIRREAGRVISPLTPVVRQGGNEAWASLGKKPKKLTRRGEISRNRHNRSMLRWLGYWLGFMVRIFRSRKCYPLPGWRNARRHRSPGQARGGSTTLVSPNG